MKRLFLLFPAVMTLSACAQPVLVSSVGDCHQVAGSQPANAFYNLNAGLPVQSTIAAYNPNAGRLDTANCPRAQERPMPHPADLNKLGGDGAVMREASNPTRPCSRG